MKNKVIVDTFNFFQFFGWTVILNLTILSLICNFLNNKDLSNQLLNATIIGLKIIQTLQITEIIFAVLKISKSPIMGSLTLITGRLVITHLFLSFTEDIYSVALIAIPWSISDIVRSLYYINKDSNLLGHFRYNLFIILFPIGVIGEILLMETKLKRDNLSEYSLYIRIYECVLLVAFFSLYTYLIGMRRKFYREIKEKKVEKTQ